MAEGLADAAAKHGLPQAQANRLVRAALAGAGESMHLLPDESMPDYRRRLTNPGGSTEAGMKVLLKENRLANLMADVVDAILKRQADRWKPKR
jgi:pyrroline-5-carboxylate reductase